MAKRAQPHLAAATRLGGGPSEIASVAWAAAQDSKPFCEVAAEGVAEGLALLRPLLLIAITRTDADAAQERRQ